MKKLFLIVLFVLLNVTTVFAGRTTPSGDYFYCYYTYNSESPEEITSVPGSYVCESKNKKCYFFSSGYSHQPVLAYCENK